MVKICYTNSTHNQTMSFSFGERVVGRMIVSSQTIIQMKREVRRENQCFFLRALIHVSSLGGIHHLTLTHNCDTWQKNIKRRDEKGR